ncbi:MAG: DUF1501 domain-containing protein [Verrucomicrobiae bacterium]|nr:DUF1501 domain-containing protein [Verrucomicrobiae bacterium]MCP5539018.1 DUF1501 domain-containing protein [Akkermansiaceae bacterium]MCP5550595.1 DUF1501 domain-containing protein [Akkermansiaceae bacterium]
MKTCGDIYVPRTRRDFLQSTAAGFGWLAFAGLNASNARAEAFRDPLAAKAPHFAPRAKRVIFLFMQGGPSHLDTFDWKPDLAAANGKSVEMDYGAKGAQRGNLLAPQFRFNPAGKSGLPISELFPELSRHADDLCLLNGMNTSNAAHPQASIALHTGSVNFVRPSMGSWVVYGLGTENQNLPGFVTINPVGNVGGAQNYGSSFLPASYQGTRIDTAAGGIANIRNRRLDDDAQRRQIDLIQSMNREFAAAQPDNPELEGVIQSYELAYKMQSSVPEVLSLDAEKAAVRERYGMNDSATEDFGAQCLMARRLAEAGVRFIQISKGGWDQHNNLKSALTRNCGAIDKPIAALLQDLKDRDMLRDTLVIWGGEFGRSPQGQNNAGDGRRHNNRGYSMWMAGGGVKSGIRHGSTDEIGGTAVEGKIDTHDLHATILHLLGIEHTKLTYRYAGRDFRLTDVYGEVAKEIIA